MGDEPNRPHFFVPHIDDASKAEEIWQAVASFARSQGWNVGDFRIFRLDAMKERAS